MDGNMRFRIGDVGSERSIAGLHEIPIGHAQVRMIPWNPSPSALAVGEWAIGAVHGERYQITRLADASPAIKLVRVAGPEDVKAACGFYMASEGACRADASDWTCAALGDGYVTACEAHAAQTLAETIAEREIAALSAVKGG